MTTALTHGAGLTALLVFTLAATAPAAAQLAPADSSAEQLSVLGQQHIKAGTDADLTQAIRLFTAALDQNIDFVPALVGLSDAHQLQAPWDGGDRRGIDLAIALGEKAVFLAPDDPDAHRTLAEAYLAKRWYRQAASHFHRLQELRPDTHAAYQLGWIEIEMGDYAAASAWYDRAHALDPADADVRSEMALTARTLGDHARAAEILREELDAHPNDHWLHRDFVMLQLQQGKAAEAVEYGARMLERAPDSVDFVTTAALANWFAGKDAEATLLYERALRLAGGDDPFTGLWGTYTSTALGDLYLRAGRQALADSMLDRSEAGYLARLREVGEGWGYMYDLARIHAVRGEREAALLWLRKAARFGFSEVGMARVDPMMASLRGDPEYDQIMVAVGRRVEGMLAQARAQAQR